MAGHLVTEDPAISFLLAEHARISELYLSTREIAERRATLYLTLTTTALGVLVALFQLKLRDIDLLETAAAVGFALLIFGLITFHRLIERSMQGTEYLRAINRIHRYFVERAPEIEPYLYWPAFDDLPKYDYRGVGGAETREVVALVDSLIFGAVVALVVLLRDTSLVLPAIASVLLALIVGLVAHRQYEHFAMSKEEKRKSSLVKFPQPSE